MKITRNYNYTIIFLILIFLTMTKSIFSFHLFFKVDLNKSLHFTIHEKMQKSFKNLNLFHYLRIMIIWWTLIWQISLYEHSSLSDLAFVLFLGNIDFKIIMSFFSHPTIYELMVAIGLIVAWWPTQNKKENSWLEFIYHILIQDDQ